MHDDKTMVERETGFEPATSTLARLHSTTELFPLVAVVVATDEEGLYAKRFGWSSAKNEKFYVYLS